MTFRICLELQIEDSPSMNSASGTNSVNNNNRNWSNNQNGNYNNNYDNNNDPIIITLKTTTMAIITIETIENMTMIIQCVMRDQLHPFDTEIYIIITIDQEDHIEVAINEDLKRIFTTKSNDKWTKS